MVLEEDMERYILDIGLNPKLYSRFKPVCSGVLSSDNVVSELNGKKVTLYENTIEGIELKGQGKSRCAHIISYEQDGEIKSGLVDFVIGALLEQEFGADL